MNRLELLSPVLEVANNYHAAIHREVTEGIKETTAECPRAISEDSTRHFRDVWGLHSHNSTLEYEKSSCGAESGLVTSVVEEKRTRVGLLKMRALNSVDKIYTGWVSTGSYGAGNDLEDNDLEGNALEGNVLPATGTTS